MDRQGIEQIIVFGCSGSAFALELDRVESIIEKGVVTNVPNAPFVAEGIVFYRDNVLPVINLARLLGMGGGMDEGLLVVVRGISEDFGLSSDRIYGIMEADRLDLKYISPEERTNPYIQGTGEYSGIEFALLDFGDIIIQDTSPIDVD